MKTTFKDCVILSMDDTQGFEIYDELLDEPLLDLGWKTHTISWKNKEVDWNNYQAVIIRSPWDYQNHAPEFLQVLADIERSTAHLENNLATVQWNIDKIYLKDLEDKGVNIVPTLWEDVVDNASLTRFFTQLSTEQLVIKPRISAGADNTFWLTKDNAKDYLPQLQQAFKQEAFMVQPFMESVINEGEFSLFYFNGAYSHAILKTPKNNDFRVQEEHGGRLTNISPEPTLLAQAKITLAAIAQKHQLPLYARVDFVRQGDSFALMEAELIEPSLYFNMDPTAAKRFAQAFDDRMKNLAL